jgi:predicted N-acyltransferase
MASKSTLRFAGSMSEVDATAWNACANPDRGLSNLDPHSRNEAFNPFISHEFLLACEQSGSASAKTGWAAAHVLVEDPAGRLIGAAPTYVKSHSMGEYVFDWSWAEAYERAGAQYYPKVQVCSPFTPVQGRRLLVASGAGVAVLDALIEGLRTLRDQVGASSIHVTFPTHSDWTRLADTGFLSRTGRQFHFFNRGYADFDAFLGSLASRKRKMIRREREQALAPGIEIVQLTGSDLREEHWDAFFRFYMDTGAKKWGRPYLNRRFFSLIGQSMANRLLLVMARRAGRWIAGAINFIGDDALYGRNWGCVEDHPFLHFEVCYYQAIAFALERKLARVEAGAQGEHKLARGYEAVETYSSHDISDPRLERAVADFLQHERVQNGLALQEYAERAPFRKG